MPDSELEISRYYPVSERDIQWGIYVDGVGRQSLPPHYRCYPIGQHPKHHMMFWEQGRKLTQHAVVFITRGQGEFESTSAGHLDVSLGNVIMLFPGEWHRYRPLQQTGWDEHWVSFGGEIIERLVERRFFSPQAPVLLTGMDDMLHHEFHALLDYLQSEPIGFQQLMSAGVVKILTAVQIALRRQRIDDRSDALVRQAKAYLEENAEELPRMPKLAESLGISVEQFRRVFKLHTDISPYQYHMLLRINRAKQLLLQTNLAIKEIARILKFENPYHFSRTFKSKTGLSPRQWRCGKHILGS